MSDVFLNHMNHMHEREKLLEREGVKVFRLSTTEREEFKECRRRWDFSSLSRQGLEPNKPAIALWFGTGIHKCLETLYNYRIEQVTQEEEDPFESMEAEHMVVAVAWQAWYDDEIERLEKSQGKLWAEQKDQFEQTKELGLGMLHGYVDWSSVKDNVEGTGFKEVLFTEREFEIPVPGPDGLPYRFLDARGNPWEIWLVGRLDMLVRDWDGKLWVMDHKTSATRLDEEKLVLDDQMTVYMWAVQQILKEPVAGCYYNVLRKKLPSVPAVLASGKGLSKAKNIDTTYDVYYHTILDKGFDPEDYAEILDHLSNKGNDFFQRAKVHRNQHELAMAGRMLLLEAIDMLNDPFIYPNQTWTCHTFCDFRPLCVAMNRNDDVDYIKKSMYRKREMEEQSVYNRETTNGD